MGVTMLPYLLGYASQGDAWRFTGFVFGVEDGNSYIAKMLSGSAGAWLFRTPYTPEAQRGVLAFLPYILLGKLASPPGLHEQVPQGSGEAHLEELETIHIDIEHHYYSVPYQLVRKQVDVRITAGTLEVLFRNKRVASHPRSHKKGGYSTLSEHMPERHKKYLEWTPARIIRWAGETGQNTQRLVSEIMASRVHPQQGYRSCLGIMRLSKSYGCERLEAA